MTVDSSAPPANASVRTIILGIDHSGRISSHDRNAPTVLGRPADKLVGSSLSDLLLDPTPADEREATATDVKGTDVKATDSKGADTKRAKSNGVAGKPESNGTVPPPAVAGDDVVQPLLDALKADREGTGMLSIRTENGGTLDAIVTVHPMKAGEGDGNVAATVLLRIPTTWPAS
jgi:hypothetical protein